MEMDIKVLIVEDEADFRQLMTFWLKSKGYSVVTASDGKSAVEMVKQQKPDIVFLDLYLPIMDGVEVLKEIRMIDKELPVIIISAYVDDPRAKKANAYSHSGIFSKGEDFSQGLTLLESALRTHKKLKRDE
jgi:CheY-like chemotaxis protein